MRAIRVYVMMRLLRQPQPRSNIIDNRKNDYDVPLRKIRRKSLARRQIDRKNGEEKKFAFFSFCLFVYLLRLGLLIVVLVVIG